ncbi:MAG: vanadium-dependent haloperoxidase [Chitinophagales bacterium]
MSFKNYSTFSFVLLSLFVIVGCQEVNNTDYKAAANNPIHYHHSVKKLTDVIVHDIFSPPQASRIYAYPNIAAYEVLRQGNGDYKSLAGQLTELKEVPQPEQEVDYCYPLASIHAFLTVGKALIFSEDKIVAHEEEVYQMYKDMGIPSSVYKRSLDYGNAVAQHILVWADGDNYKQTRTFPKYSITENPEKWKPTPPSYMDGIEPHWRDIRPFVIDSAQQFVPMPPPKFDMTKGSDFYKETMHVYETIKNITEDQTAIASFWDCNPYVSHQTGHVMYATKKITPGGHWMGIVSIATQQDSADIMRTSEVYTAVSIALADAFISCWDEKYRSNLIRPETVINEYIDENWLPVLQTPPFPEHTSGHSVISTAAAVMLTHLMGDNFAFVDTTEVEYGLPPRSFNSFYHASDEAAISRLYGGIHYMPAIDYGVIQGKNVGKFVVENLMTNK